MNKEVVVNIEMRLKVLVDVAQIKKILHIYENLDSTFKVYQ